MPSGATSPMSTLSGWAAEPPLCALEMPPGDTEPAPHPRDGGSGLITPCSPLPRRQDSSPSSGRSLLRVVVAADGAGQRGCEESTVSGGWGGPQLRLV